MDILELALKLTEIVKRIADEKDLSESEAWDEAIIMYKEKYER